MKTSELSRHRLRNIFPSYHDDREKYLWYGTVKLDFNESTFSNSNTVYYLTNMRQTSYISHIIIPQKHLYTASKESQRYILQISNNFSNYIFNSTNIKR